ncbi:PAS domain S-box protein [Maribellus maritimus]|uniref:PAS domain S-box protein n=1 Tax=Maribellus maritimus TaxID=2870838 RepID=UPI001EEA2B27|nr:PAS domain S-box protein [Maribellus maritimus]MCG6185811.1 PAS domain-containing sensor histidine kinase [Maribellus maritimus]
MNQTEDYIKKLEEENQNLKRFLDVSDKKVLRKMFNSHRAIMLMIEQETGQIVDANEAAVAFYKYPKKELLSLKIEDINMLSPDEIKRERKKVTQRKKDYFIFPHRIADGTIRQVEVYTSLYNINKKPTLFSIIHDVTERVEAEKELRRNEEKFVSAFKSNPNSMIISNLDNGKIYDVNDAFFELTGLTRKNITGATTLSIDLYADPNDRDRLIQIIKKTGSVRNFETKLHHLSGKTLTVLISSELLKKSEDRTIITTMLDITQRKQLKDQLESNNVLLQTIFDSVPAMITIYNPDLQQIDVNKEFERITGWSEVDIRKKNIMELVYPDPEYRKKAAMFMQSLQPGFKDFVMTGKGGNEIETIWANVKLEDGRQVGIGIDNRERKAAQKELQQSQETIKAALYSMTDAVFIFDPELKLLYYNDAFVTFHRFKNREECPNVLADYNEFLALFFPDESPAPVKDWPGTKALKGKSATNAEYILLRKDTGEKWVGSYSFGPIISNDGKITGAVIVVRDVTQQKNAEVEREYLLKQLALDKQALAESEQRYRIMGESVDYGVWATDAEGKTIHISESFCKMVGKSFEEIQDFGWIDTLVPEQQQEVMDLWMASVNTGDRFEHEHKFLTKDGELKMVLAIGMPIKDDNDKIVSWAGINLDITDRKKIELQLEEKNNHLTKLNDVLEDFFKIAAHDLRSPIQNLIDINELVKQSAPEDKLTLVEMLEPTTIRLKRTVDGLMEAVSIQTKQELAIAQIRFIKVWKEVAAELSNQITNFQGTIETDFEDAPEIHFIEAHLVSILRNLVSNAIKYASEAKKSFVKISTIKEEKSVLLSVEDNGIGINLKNAGSELFKPFKRFTSKVEGTGMGLYIVKNIVEKNGGYIRVESKINKGTTFYCHLKEYTT